MAAVTVVTTTFNRPDLLRKALDSLRAQTFKDFDVLICDNANDPTVAELVRGFDDGRFRYVGRPENLGLMRNAIEGFRAVTSDLAVKLDDDDEFDSQFLELTVGALRDHPTAVLSFGHRRFIGPDEVFLPEYQQLQAELSVGSPRPGIHCPFLDLVLDGSVSLNAAVVRTSAVPWADLKADTVTAFDLHILLEAAGDATEAVHVPNAEVRYRVHPESDTSQRLARQLEGRLAAISHALDSSKAYDRALLKRHRDIASVQLAREQLRNGDQNAARRALRLQSGSKVTFERCRLAVMAWFPKPVAQRVSRWRLRRWQDSVESTGGSS